MKRAVFFAAAIALALAAAIFATSAQRDRGATATSSPPPNTTPSASAPAAVPSPTATAASTSPTAASVPPAPAQLVLSDRFGFLVQNRAAWVRSETSDAAATSFTPGGRSFSSLSRMVSPDGRLVAYWDPVDRGAVLRVRSVTGGDARAVITGGPDMSGNAFTWSSDSGGLAAALDNNCFEICTGRSVAELWTVDLASGATEKIAAGSIWLPVAWDRSAKLVAAGVTGSGGYLTAYNVIDLNRLPYAVRGAPFQPPIIGRLTASGDARYVLLITSEELGRSSLTWWPIAEPQKSTTAQFDGITAVWRPATDEIWWVGGREPAGCRIEVCAGTQLTAIDVTTGTRTTMLRGRFGSLLEAFRVDGSAAVISQSGSVRTELMLVEIATGRTASLSIGGSLEGTVRLR